MNLKSSTALLFCSVLGGAAFGVSFGTPAIARCVQADIGVQYNISGSRAPTRRSNDVRFEGRGRCVGNTSVTTGVQGNVGGSNPVIQRRRVRHRFRGDKIQRRLRGRAYDRYDRHSDDLVRTKVNPQVDVYNPADRWR